MKPGHIVLCLAFVVAGVVLVAAGVGAAVVLPVLGCAAMMGMMGWMMMRSGGSDGGQS